jgi:predicted transcriptional regulator
MSLESVRVDAKEFAMSTLTVPISEAAHRQLQELAANTGEPVQNLIEKAVDEYWRKRFWDETNAAYAALRSNAGDWKVELAERALSENTLMDGLEEDE